MSPSGAALLAGTRVVLIAPRGGSNLGAVARAMKNFGLQHLILVRERIRSLPDAYRMAVHAGDVLDGAVRTADLEAALAGATFVVGTSNRPEPGMTVLTPRQVAEASRQHGPPTLLFGGEEHGLELATLRRCHAVSMVPTAPAQSSLNLAQAVLLYAAELFQVAAADPGVATAPRPLAAPAPHDLLRRLEHTLHELLQTSLWAAKSRPDDQIGRLVQPWYRAGLTEAEVRAWLVALRRIGKRGPEAGSAG